MSSAAWLESNDLAQAADGFRAELRLHCYRMLGSLRDSEDAVQETMLRAWRAASSLRGRQALRPWLYRIATRVCLDEIARRPARASPDQLGPPSTRMEEMEPASDELWAEPIPDALIGPVEPGPEARLDLRQSIELAFIAAVQGLPGRQRAALLLRDVIGYSAEETALLLDVTVTAANSLLQRARAHLAERRGKAPAMLPPSENEIGLAKAYADAWETRNIGKLVALLTDESVFVMPPWRTWFRGTASIGGFFSGAWQHYSGFRCEPVAANFQQGFVVYLRDGRYWRAHSLHVLEVEHRHIARVTCFVRPMGPRLFASFGKSEI